MSESVPAACTLPTASRPVRLGEINGLLRTAVRSAERRGSTLLHLDLAPDAAARAADLLVRESACCSFFTFTLTMTGGSLTLDVGVPPAHVDVLDALAGRAAP